MRLLTNEAKTLLFFAQHPEGTMFEAADATGLQTRVIHTALVRLAKPGFIGSEVRGRRRYRKTMLAQAHIAALQAIEDLEAGDMTYHGDQAYALGAQGG